MKRRTLASCIALLLSAVILTGSAGAAAPEFTDVEGHWAADTLRRAWDDGYLQGYADGTLRPDEAVTTAQVLTLLTRALADMERVSADGLAAGSDPQSPLLGDSAAAESPEPLAVPEDAWYYAAAAEAYARGLIPADPGDLEQPAVRAKVFVLAARAFGLVWEDADPAILDRFSDKYMVDRDDMPVLAGLVSRHLLQGDGGQLRPRDKITRAECLSVLYRLLDSRDGPSEAEALATVVSGYQGDWTLAWAEANDYSPEIKERWVSAQGYESETDYLIWVNISHQRVNIFRDTGGFWALERSCIVGTGAPGTDTPVGVWQLTYKNAAGWLTSTYTVKPVVGFKGGGYAFHSRLYVPGTTTLSDPSIGFPVSHGCVRMYDADIQYIYDTIPVGTTVVVY